MSEMERSIMFFSLGMLLWESKAPFMAAVVWMLGVLLAVQSIARNWV